MKKLSLLIGVATIATLAACSDRSPQVGAASGDNYSTPNGANGSSPVGATTGTNTASNVSGMGATTNTPSTVTGSSVSTSSGTSHYTNP